MTFYYFVASLPKDIYMTVMVIIITVSPRNKTGLSIVHPISTQKENL